MSYVPTLAYNTAAVNTDVVITLTGVDASTAPVSTARHMLKQIAWSLDADPASAVNLKIESPSGTVIESFYITKGGPGSIEFVDKGLPCALASNTIITLDIGASDGVTGTLSVIYDFA